MSAEQVLKKEIDEKKIWLNREHDESTDKRDLIKRIELINWVLENMKGSQHPDFVVLLNQGGIMKFN